MGYTNSPLVSYTKLSPNHSGTRNHSIDRITPHCVVGQCSVEVLGSIFASPSRQASSNYGIGADGRVGMYVAEKNRSWCSSSGANDNRAVTIECASDASHPYAFRTVVYQKLIDLCVDICQRNGKTKLLWLGDKNKTLNYTPKSNEMILTVHRWFANKSCPGDWMYSRMGDLAKQVTNRLNKSTVKPETPKPKKKTEIKASKYASSFDKEIAGSYRTTDYLNMRDGAGTSHKILTTLKKGLKVKCFGYYTKVNKVKWYYVQVTVSGVKYTGFCSSEYLKKV